ncbi:MAG: asparagine synthase (glutamine-hydrolyzing) [Bacteroidia bacterium]
MCGIAGYIDYTGKSNADILKKMTGAVYHRGPDDDGYEIFNRNDVTVGFGFRRLSIIELSDLGHQPMVNEHSGDVIIYNGEVYNYREIRNELEQDGFKFRGKSDTEVILKAYEKWGNDCVHHFNGMFAFVIYDAKKQKVIFFRDRAGVKPLYYYWKDGIFLFGSELKSFHQHPSFKKELDKDALALYFHHGYIPSPYCIFKNTFKLMPGHILEFDLSKQNFDLKKYWSVPDAFNQPKLDISFEDAAAELEKMFVSAFKYRMIADVPVGVFLSGGYDSTCVAALLQKNSAQKIKTYTISFKEMQYDEAAYAKAVADHIDTEHYEYVCTEKDAIYWLQMFPEIFDEPFADAVAIPNLIVSEMAHQQVKVALSADGGDELFAGYTRYQKAIADLKSLNRIPLWLRKLFASGVETFHSGAKKSLLKVDNTDRLYSYSKTDDVLKIYNRINQSFTDNEIKRFMVHSVTDLHTPFHDNNLLADTNDNLGRILAVDQLTYLTDDILQKVDKTSMWVSLEAREPMLDYHIIEFAARLPSQFKLNGKSGKHILKHIVHKHVPEKLVNRPKKGFGIPLPQWGTQKLKPFFDSFMDEKKIEDQKIFNTPKVMELYNHYSKGNTECFDRVWLFISFQMWWNRWMTQFVFGTGILYF